MSIKVAITQISPVLLNSKETWKKLKTYLKSAVDQGATIITWGETLLPGYPHWIAHTNGAKFNDESQKKAYSKYWFESLTIPNDCYQNETLMSTSSIDSDPNSGEIIREMCQFASQYQVMLIGGIAERFSGSLYCTLITIGANGKVIGRHRKIKPTYEERLIWADGDGTGLYVHPTPVGNIGALNCWENWLPLARACLHQQQEFIHVAIWPGSLSLTQDISKFMALEGRYFVISACGLLQKKDFENLDEKEFPLKQQILALDEKDFQNGGSMIVNPKGEIIAGPLVDKEGILLATLDSNIVVQERQNMDYSGHYYRPDIFKLTVTQKKTY